MSIRTIRTLAKVSSGFSFGISYTNGYTLLASCIRLCISPVSVFVCMYDLCLFKIIVLYNCRNNNRWKQTNTQLIPVIVECQIDYNAHPKIASSKRNEELGALHFHSHPPPPVCWSFWCLMLYSHSTNAFYFCECNCGNLHCVKYTSMNGALLIELCWAGFIEKQTLEEWEWVGIKNNDIEWLRARDQCVHN